MEKPKVAGKQPRPVEVDAGKSYYWCACGRSANQPFCDGSHKGTGLTPVPWTADAGKEVYFCMCKQTKTPPFCDGSHNSLEK